ncbi:lipoprotein signal peptidase [Ectothiorhodospiraceae bacterium WFHF3C12]|nr:lipoprotein signal peptidase [Ectothiorhodospiraceae bacterium WFHF3C12]
MARHRALWIGVGVALLVVFLDQATKLAAEAWLMPYRPVSVMPMLNMTLSFNTGAAFSFLHDQSGWQRWFFAALALVVSGALVVWLARLGRSFGWQGLGIALILGGAVGNLIDRLAYGHVIDFIDVYYGDWHWPAFNIADSGITVGAVILIAESVFAQRQA